MSNPIVPLFSITGVVENVAKGFQITFANGLMLSVQFGSGNYCKNRDINYRRPAPDSPDAEIAVIDTTMEKGENNENHHVVFVTDLFCDCGDTVAGWQTPDQVAEVMIKVKNATREQITAYQVQFIR